MSWKPLLATLLLCFCFGLLRFWELRLRWVKPVPSCLSQPEAPPPRGELAGVSCLSWKEWATTWDTYRPMCPCGYIGMSFRPHLHVPVHSVLPLVGQRAPLLRVSMCVCTWVSLWGARTSVCHFAHRHAFMGLCASCTGTHSYVLRVGPPALCLLFCLWLPLSTFECTTGLHAPLKAAFTRHPSMAPDYLTQ